MKKKVFDKFKKHFSGLRQRTTKSEISIPLKEFFKLYSADSEKYFYYDEKWNYAKLPKLISSAKLQLALQI